MWVPAEVNLADTDIMLNLKRVLCPPQIFEPSLTTANTAMTHFEIQYTFLKEDKEIERT